MEGVKMSTNKTEYTSYLDDSVIDTMILFAEARKANVIPLHQSLKIQLSPEATQRILSKNVRWCSGVVVMRKHFRRCMI